MKVYESLMQSMLSFICNEKITVDIGAIYCIMDSIIYRHQKT